MTFWLVTVFCLLAILSPLLWLRPTPRDKRLLTLRQKAAQADIGVKFAKVPLHNPPGGMISYRFNYAQQRPGPLFVLVREAYASQALKPACIGWRWRIEPLRALPEHIQQCLEEALATLPEDALVVESERPALTLWWGESLSADEFLACAETLKALRDALAEVGETASRPGMRSTG